MVACGGARAARAVIRWRGRSPAPPATAAVVRPALDDVVERPGEGMEGRLGDRIVRLGRRELVGGGPGRYPAAAESEIWLRVGDEPPLRFAFEDTLRTDAADTSPPSRRLAST